MADIKANPVVVRQKLVSNIAGLVANIERQRLELLQMEEQRSKNEENIAATVTAVARLEEELKKLDA